MLLWALADNVAKTVRFPRLLRFRALPPTIEKQTRCWYCQPGKALQFLKRLNFLCVVDIVFPCMSFSFCFSFFASFTMVIERPVISLESEVGHRDRLLQLPVKSINQSPYPCPVSQISISVGEAETQTRSGACVGPLTWSMGTLIRSSRRVSGCKTKSPPKGAF